MDGLTSMNALLVAILIVLVIILLLEWQQLEKADKSNTTDTIPLDIKYCRY